MPVDMAGNAIDVSCKSSATRIDSRWQLASFSRFIAMATSPARAHGVYDVARRQSAGRRGHGLSLGKRSLLRDNLAAVLFDLRSACGVYRTVNPAAAHQRRIGGVHNGINLLARDVGRTGDDQQAAFAKINAQRDGSYVVIGFAERVRFSAPYERNCRLPPLRYSQLPDKG